MKNFIAKIRRSSGRIERWEIKARNRMVAIHKATDLFFNRKEGDYKDEILEVKEVKKKCI